MQPPPSSPTKNSYEQLGAYNGILALTNRFYDIMSKNPEAKRIRTMHPEDLSATRENLALFLYGWLGGPSLYLEKYGSINLTHLHALLDINTTDRDMWLSCMAQALQEQVSDKKLRDNLLKRLKIPAEKIRQTCAQRQQGLASHLT